MRIIKDSTHLFTWSTPLNESQRTGMNPGGQCMLSTELNYLITTSEFTSYPRWEKKSEKSIQSFNNVLAEKDWWDESM